jgi:hypothetical protein
MIILQPDPHHVHGNHEPLVTKLNCAHESELEIREEVTGARMNADFLAGSTDRSVNPRKPEVRGGVDMPVAIVVARFGLSRTW